jgi:urease accessory protein
MRATARVVAVAGTGGGGATRLAVLRSEPPLVLRRTGPAQVHLVGAAAGPLGGDHLRLDVEVGPGARLCLRTVAASIALPDRSGHASRIQIHATVAPGGQLTWLPEPLIAASGCRHVTVSTVELAAGAALHWRDELVCGRHGEPSGDVRLGTAVHLAGRPLCQHELAVGPSAPGWSGAAVLGGAGAVGSLLLVNPEWTESGPPPPRVLGDSAALMPLAGPAALAVATAPDLPGVRTQLDAAIPAPCAARPMHAA